jgi:AcrR family transcriptional regulator
VSAPQIGLRSIKKQMTSESIANAALALTLEKGLANVTVEDIARVAFVSPRTFSNYYSCKEAAVVAAGNEFSGLLKQFATAPTDEPPLHVLRREVTEFLRRRSPDDLERSRGRLKLMTDNPSLVPYQVALYDDLEREFRSIVAQRSGTDLRTDMYPWLVAAAAMSAARVAMRVWAQSDATADALPGIIEAAFDQVDNGFASPRDARPTLSVTEIPAQPEGPEMADAPEVARVPDRAGAPRLAEAQRQSR